MNIIDVLTTIYLLESGIGYEGNPLARSFMNIGYLGLVLMKAMGITIIMFLLTKFKYNQNLIAYPSMVIGMVVVWNLFLVIL